MGSDRTRHGEPLRNLATSLRALSLARDVAAVSGLSLSGLLARKVRRERLFRDLPSGRARVDVYRAADLRGRATPAVVASLGMFFRGTDDQRFRELCRALARAGFTVVAPDHAEFKGYLYDPAVVDRLVDVHELARSLPGVDPASVGLMGFCLGGSVSLIAAARPRIRDAVRFVATFGTYYDWRSWFRYLLLGEHEHAGVLYRGQPRPIWGPIIVAVAAPYLGLGPEEPLQIRDYGVEIIGGDEARIAASWDRLTPAAQGFLSALTAADRRATVELAERITAVESPPESSPSEVIGRIGCKAFVFHGKQDEFVPFTEGLKLGEALAARGPTRVLLSDMIAHTEVGKARSIAGQALEIVRYWLFIRDIVREGAGGRR